MTINELKPLHFEKNINAPHNATLDDHDSNCNTASSSLQNNMLFEKWFSSAFKL